MGERAVVLEEDLMDIEISDGVMAATEGSHGAAVVAGVVGGGRTGGRWLFVRLDACFNVGAFSED